MAEPKTIPLKYPVPMNTVGEDKKTRTVMLTEVTVRRAKARDLRNLPPGSLSEYAGNGNAMAPAMVALYCGIPLEVAEEVDFEDLMEIMKEMPSLTSGFSGIGGKSSGESPESSTSHQSQSGT